MTGEYTDKPEILTVWFVLKRRKGPGCSMGGACREQNEP